MRSLSSRVIPALLLCGRGLVKTVQFKEPKYIGDPRNAVKIFNEKEVDELALLDILATVENRSPDFDLVEEIVSEAFMPVAYGGGIASVADAEKVIALGVEKVVINSAAHDRPGLIQALADGLGTQSVVVSMDVRRKRGSRYEVYSRSASSRTKLDPVAFARTVELAGAGELLLTAVDRDGTQEGYDLDLIRMVSDAVDIPVIAAGGAGSLEHMADAVGAGHASAVAAGSIFVFQGRHRSVMISYPSRRQIDECFSNE